MHWGWMCMPSAFPDYINQIFLKAGKSQFNNTKAKPLRAKLDTMVTTGWPVDDNTIFKEKCGHLKMPQGHFKNAHSILEWPSLSLKWCQLLQAGPMPAITSSLALSLNIVTQSWNTTTLPSSKFWKKTTYLRALHQSGPTTWYTFPGYVLRTSKQMWLASSVFRTWFPNTWEPAGIFSM